MNGICNNLLSKKATLEIVLIKITQLNNQKFKWRAFSLVEISQCGTKMQMQTMKRQRG